MGIQERINRSKPQNKFAAFALFRSYNKLANVYLEINNFEEAKFYFEKSEGIFKFNDTEAMGVSQKLTVVDHLWSFGKYYLKRAEITKNNSQKLSDLQSSAQKLSAAFTAYQSQVEKDILDPAYAQNPSEIEKSLAATKARIAQLLAK